jgi:hypothetical protein
MWMDLGYAAVRNHIATLARGRRCLKIDKNARCGRVAQLGEHLLCKQGVRGSNPLTSTKNRIETRFSRDRRPSRAMVLPQYYPRQSREAQIGPCRASPFPTCCGLSRSDVTAHRICAHSLRAPFERTQELGESDLAVEPGGDLCRRARRAASVADARCSE